MNQTFDAVSRSVMSGALAGIAEEMGMLLIRGAYSSNIKERRDCSTALFDRHGRMIAQAAHIPVHLGAMPQVVATVREMDPRPGDAFVVNDPYSGGSHLPDVTMVSPIVREGTIIGYTASRAHQNDIGGSRPGSMPSGSREIYQEGLIIPPVRLARGGEIMDDVLRLILANVRTPYIRKGDLYAQLAANKIGETRFNELVDRRGLDTVEAACADILDYTERRTREAISALPDGTYTAESCLEGDGVTDDDFPIRVSLTVDGDSLRIDFTGTSAAAAGNINCPLAVTRSSCYFAVQTVLAKDVPIKSAGTYAPISVEAPVGCLVNAQHPSAIVAGNVETSQRIADTVLEALSHVADVSAPGMGTTNVLVLGGRTWTYVETLGGGQGAHSCGAGSSGVHVGITNTLNTPIESLELEYPLRIEQYELAYGSGGEGAHTGGDGLIRTIRLQEPASVSLLTDRRTYAPGGAESGESARTGSNLINGQPVAAKTNQELDHGDVVTVVTPGGGGHGAAN
ncbi:hydantoinase B/oxoprolinase family protein [Streptomyces sp. NPDC058045]|uniref:hydantoinase B/oxoprolinase family protein n=1 Tax=Streptomyces sp. NPDC058045 TaxID=3346311 RepID=UPI0036EE9EE8